MILHLGNRRAADGSRGGDVAPGWIDDVIDAVQTFA
jgi:hypothetical protein